MDGCMGRRQGQRRQQRLAVHGELHEGERTAAGRLCNRTELGFELQRRRATGSKQARTTKCTVVQSASCPCTVSATASCLWCFGVCCVCVCCAGGVRRSGVNLRAAGRSAASGRRHARTGSGPTKHRKPSKPTTNDTQWYLLSIFALFLRAVAVAVLGWAVQKGENPPPTAAGLW